MTEGSLDYVDAKSLRADNGCYFNKRNRKIHFCTRRAEKHALSTSEKSSLSSATGLRDDCCEYFISLTVHVLLCLDPFDFNRRLPLETSIFFLMAITLNIASCPFTILMNVLVIVAVKTRRQLQTNYNVLLACLAVTDLLIGVFVQPIFAVALITVLKGSLTYYCQFLLHFQSCFSFLLPLLYFILLYLVQNAMRR